MNTEFYNLTDKEIYNAFTISHYSNIFVVGDFMLDIYYYLDYLKQSQEKSHVPVFKMNNKTIEFGGAGNVYKNLKNIASSNNVYFFGGAGNDVFDYISMQEYEKNINFEIDKFSKTTTKTRYIANNMLLYRVDDDNSITPSKEFIEAFNYKLNTLKPKLILLEDYNKKFLTQDIIDSVYNYKLQNKNVMVMLDPHPSNKLNFYDGLLDIVTPNKSEYCSLLNIQDIEDSSKIKFSDIFKNKYTCITCGPDGIRLYENDMYIDTYNVIKQVSLNATGAGDTVISMIGFFLLGGFCISTAIMLAALAGSIVVQSINTSCIDNIDTLVKVFNKLKELK